MKNTTQSMNCQGKNCNKCQHNICTYRVPIFSDLEPDEMMKITELIVSRKYARGEMIVMEGNQLEGLYIIHSGRVKAFRYTQEAKEQILYLFAEGDFFGEKNLLRKQPVTYHAEALEETQICVIPHRSFHELLKEAPSISYKIMDQLCIRIDHLETLIQNMGTRDMEARISAILIEFAKKYGSKQNDGILVSMPLSREGIANYIGVTRETISRKLSRLQDDGIIEQVGNKKIKIYDLKALEQEYL